MFGSTAMSSNARGDRAGKVESGPAGRGDSTRVHSIRRVSSGRLSPRAGERSPQHSGELAAGRVPGAHEQRPLRHLPAPGPQTIERAPDQMYVTAAAVAARLRTDDHPRRLEHVEVVGEQTRLDVHQSAQFHRRSVGDGKIVHDRQPDRITERRMPSGSLCNIPIHERDTNRSAQIQSIFIELVPRPLRASPSCGTSGTG